MDSNFMIAIAYDLSSKKKYRRLNNYSKQH